MGRMSGCVASLSSAIESGSFQWVPAPAPAPTNELEQNAKGTVLPRGGNPRRKPCCLSFLPGRLSKAEEVMGEIIKSDKDCMESNAGSSLQGVGSLGSPLTVPTLER